jgi:hypothetical protein
MAIILRFQPADLLQCRFAVSPLGEVTDALRFLARTARHAPPGADGYHLPWQRQVRPLLADLGIGPLLALTGISGYQPDFLNPVPDSPFAEIGTEIDRVRAAPPDRVAAEMAKALALPGAPGPGADARGRPDAARALADHPWLADAPAKARDTLAGMLEVAWTALIEPWWPRMRDILDADITYRARRMANAGIAATIGAQQVPNAVARRGAPLRPARGFPGAGPFRPGTRLGPECVRLARGWHGLGSPIGNQPGTGIFGLWEPGARSAGDLARLIGKTRAELLTALADPPSTPAEFLPKWRKRQLGVKSCERSVIYGENL